MRPLLASLVLVVALAGLTGCDRGGPAAEDDASADLAAEMCRAVDEAEDGDLPAARSAFEDAHAGLHTLADELAGTERQRAADLLRAKQAVESALSGTSADRLATHLRDLARALDDSAPCV